MEQFSKSESEEEEEEERRRGEEVDWLTDARKLPSCLAERGKQKTLMKLTCLKSVV